MFILQGDVVGDMKVTVDSASSTIDDSSLVTGKEMTKTADGYTLDLMSLNPEPGFYELTVSAKPAKADPKLVGNTAVKLNVKVPFIFYYNIMYLFDVGRIYSDRGKIVVN